VVCVRGAIGSRGGRVCDVWVGRGRVGRRWVGSGWLPPTDPANLQALNLPPKIPAPILFTPGDFYL
jgi:hypothetical protein